MEDEGLNLDGVVDAPETLRDALEVAVRTGTFDVKRSVRRAFGSMSASNSGPFPLEGYDAPVLIQKEEPHSAVVEEPERKRA